MSSLQPRPDLDKTGDNNDQPTTVGFPTKELSKEEKAQRVMGEAQRLANLAPGEWRLWVAASAERLGMHDFWYSLKCIRCAACMSWALAIHPSERILAVASVGGSADPVVRFLDVGSGVELKQFCWKVGRIQCLAFSPDGLTCAAGCSDHRLVVWDVDL